MQVVNARDKERYQHQRRAENLRTLEAAQKRLRGQPPSVCNNSWVNCQCFAKTLLILESNVPLSLEP